MKFLTLIAVLAVLACSESNTPLPIENPPAAHSAPPSRVHYSIPDGIHPNLAAHFAAFQSNLTEREYQFLLMQVHDYCYGGTLPFHWRVRNNLSERAVQRVFNLDDGIGLIPPKRLRDKDRIQVAAYFNASIYRIEHGQAYYTDAYHLIIIELVQDTHGRGTGASSETNYHTYNDNPGDSKKIESIYRFISEKFLGEHVVEVPPIPADLNLALFVVNIDGNLLSTVHEGRGTIYALEDIPRATDAQMELYNQILAPDAYDCVEFGVNPDDAVIFNQRNIDE